MGKPSGPTGPSGPTVKRLFALSGNRCAFPNCASSLVDQPSGSIIGEMCHIKGKKLGAARFDATQTDEERHGFDNLILLCGPYHKVIDEDEQRYTVDALREMKATHDAAGREEDTRVDEATADRFVTCVLSSAIGEGSVVSSNCQSQNVRISEISGHHNVVTVQQPHGIPEGFLMAILEKLENNQRVDAGPPQSFHSDIDSARDYIRSGKPDVAIELLTQLKQRYWDKFSEREKYRVLANIGHAHEAKEAFGEAAAYFIKAKSHQPDDEQARCFEAMGQFSLGNSQDAYRLANAILADFPQCCLAHALRIRAAPPTSTFEELESNICLQSRSSVEVLHALGWRAMAEGLFDHAERSAREALQRQPESAEIKELLAVALVQQEARRLPPGDPTGSTSCLDQAVRLLTDALASKKGCINQTQVRIRYIRAAAYELTGDPERAETDYRAARELDPDDPEVAKRFAIFLLRRGKEDAAIDVLRSTSTDSPVENSVILAELLAQRNHEGDRRVAVDILEASVSRASTVASHTRAEIISALSHLYELLNDNARGLALVDGLPADFLSESVALAVKANISRRAGSVDAAVRFAHDAMGALNARSDRHELTSVALALTRVGQHEAAMSVWKKLITPDHIGEDTHIAYFPHIWVVISCDFRSA